MEQLSLKAAAIVVATLFASPSGAEQSAPSSAARLPYDGTQPVPAGYRVERRPYKGLLVGGWVTFGISYGLSSVLALLAPALEDGSAGWMIVPLAGPFLWAATTQYASTKERLNVAVLYGGLQLAGAGMLIIGYHGRRELVREDVPRLGVVPMLTPHVQGLALVGSF